MGKRIKKYFTTTLYYLILFVSGNSVYSQSVVSGTVTDTLQQPVAFANVFLKPNNSDAIIAFSTTQEDGTYKITTDKTGDFQLSFSSISYTTKTVPVSLQKDETKTVNAVLNEATFALDEVIINNDKAITVKEDTIIYNADSFKQGTEETVEDLLKNLPGVEVENDGTVKVGGKKVEKVMVEGDDLFEKGYKLLTKNLDASVVDKVEVYEKYSSNRLLKNIEESDKVALNLTLTKEAKNQLFGVVRPGYGLGYKNKYDSKANLISFREKSKYYLFANFNNIGENVTGDIDQLLGEGQQNSFVTNNDGGEAVSFINLFRKPNDIGDARTNFNNAEMGSLTNIQNLSDKVKLKTIGFFNWDERDFFKNKTENYFLPTGDFTNTENYSLRGKQFTGFGKTTLTYDISKTKSFEYSGDYNSTDLDTGSNLLFNNSPSNERLNEYQFSTHQNLTYTHKFKKNQVFLLTGMYLFDRKPQDYTNNRFLFDGLFMPEETVDGVFQDSEHSLHSAKVEASLFNRKDNGDLFKLDAGLDYQDNQYKSSFQLENDENTQHINPTGFQNSLTYQLFSGYVRSSYRREFGNFALTGNLELRQHINSLKNREGSQNKSPFFINPEIILDWQPNDKNKLISSFKFEQENPSLPNINDDFVLKRYNYFSKGVATLEPLKTSTFLVNYTLGHYLSTFFSNTTFYYKKYHDYFASNSVITPNFTTRELVRLEDRDLLNIQTEGNIYFAALNSNLKLKGGFSTQKYQNSVNKNFRDVELQTYTYGMEVRSAFSGPFNFHIGTEWFESVFKTTQKSTSFTGKQTNMTNKSFLDLIYKPFKKLNISANGERYFFDNLDSDNNTYYFMDMEAKYTVLKNKLSFSVEGKNLFNIKNFNNINIDDTGIISTQYRLLPRFVLLKMRVRF
ncbi:carboxypeptidase-like regulatory domain-containing protein [Marixanthomonas ophiurae]|uniref:Carboxypeptidase-like regulatory domain-containing protein n=1 Tax=Marixanthomonas ophiurae TaxID=387659 RepID=A0A3E1QAB1_9FLAO|nr:carboxypeptidase-like regulatory domain-containing protein [Marixanthomonas ophiurae]RFN59073.1 carboxypeptidase-like regulatory domain-containing protein [Marixanthomonas ophiurae]